MKFHSITLALGLGLSSLAYAQADPAGTQQRFERDRIDRLKREQQLNKPAPTQPAISLPGEKPVGEVSDVKNIAVTRFEVDPSAVLSADEIDGVLAPYRGTTVSLKDLFAAVASLNKLYDAKGAKTSRAILPAQDAPSVNVNVEAVMPDRMAMAITEMPTRKTTSQVVRDGDNNIVSTIQTETDQE